MSHVTLVETKPGEFEFRLPDIGEGVVEGEIVKWLVKEGDAVKEDQPVVEIMTDKATVEIPSPKSGTIVKRFWEEGQICPVGQGLVLIAAAGGAPAQVAPAAPATMQHPGAKAEPAAATPAAAPKANGNGASSNGHAAPAATGEKALAAPATRKLARELGIDINAVAGTGPHGRVTQDDVRAFQAGGGAPAAAAKAPAAPMPRGAAEDEERRPLRGLRRKIAEKMVQSAFTAPHVTTFDEVDLTALVAMRARMKPKAEAAGVKLSYMPFFMKAVIAALRQFPLFNASLDDATNEIVVKKRYHMGFAAATDNGLLVPVVKDADQKSLLQIAREMGEIAERTRAGKATADELSGSTFTISNVGSIGGLFATPIINHPEVAILGVNSLKKRPVVMPDGSIQARDMMYLGLSFDHRVSDGAEAVQFLNAVISYLQDPELLLLEM
jgi:pyruvate dehydrogenase E2 component (dihydrolipoamide acetyltransferase)